MAGYMLQGGVGGSQENHRGFRQVLRIQGHRHAAPDEPHGAARCPTAPRGYEADANARARQ
jgi:hypothetical protein